MSMIGSADVAPASAAFRRGASSNAAEVPMNWRRDTFEQRRVYMAYVVTKPSLSLFRPLFKQENAASSARSASCHHYMTLVDSSPHDEGVGRGDSNSPRQFDGSPFHEPYPPHPVLLPQWGSSCPMGGGGG